MQVRTKLLFAPHWLTCQGEQAALLTRGFSGAFGLYRYAYCVNAQLNKCACAHNGCQLAISFGKAARFCQQFRYRATGDNRIRRRSKALLKSMEGGGSGQRRGIDTMTLHFRGLILCHVAVGDEHDADGKCGSTACGLAAARLR